MTMDLKDFYYDTPMEKYKYMKTILYSIPQDIIGQYQMASIEYKGWIYTNIQKGMPGLKQAEKMPTAA